MICTRICLLVVAFVTFAGMSARVESQSVPSVTGTVTDAATGRKLIGVLITLGAPPDTRATRTDESGSFEFRNITVGNYALSARQIGYEASTRSVRVSDQITNDIALTRLAALDTLRVRGGRQRIYGVVATAEGLQPIANATVQVLGTSAGQVTTDSTGRFSYNIQTPGAYMVRGKFKDRGVATTSVTVQKESSVEVALLLDSAALPGANALEMAYAESRERMIRRGMASAFVSRAQLMESKRPGVLGALLARTVNLNGLRFTDVACVYLDGKPMPGLSATPINPADVEAVEVYSSTGDRSRTLVARWPREASCGDTGMSRLAPPRVSNSGRSAPSDIVAYIVIWLKH